ncbi:MAG: DUF2207 domain-containing protein [Desulfobaccales bacterium]
MVPAKYVRLFLFLGLVFWGLSPFPGPAASMAEKILYFRSDIRVHPDASLTVTETITVRSAGVDIKRGIVRDFPTTYRDRDGKTVRVGFDLTEVRRDGRPEPYHIKDVSNGKKIFLGDRNIFLRPGIYTYTLTYRTDRQLGFFQGFDELYWNVTGNGWTFAIDRAEAVVALPPGAKVLNYAAYTGRTGEQGQDFRVSYDQAGNIVFTTTRGLAAYEGLTIAVSWPKGLVTEPSRTEKLGFLFFDNLTTLVAFLGLVGTLLYYLVIWYQVGRDPGKGTIIPLFTPPQRFSPAGVRYLMRMGFDQKTFAAAVVDMAVKGYLRIEEDAGGDFILRRTGKNPVGLDAGEQRLGAALFQLSDFLKLENTNHERIRQAREALKGKLDQELNHIYFRTNLSWFILGALMSFLTLLAIVLTSDTWEALFPVAWLSIWGVGCFLLAMAAYRHWKGALRGPHLHYGKALTAIASTIFAMAFIAGELLGLGFLAMTVSTPAVLAFALLVLINFLFYYLLKAPTMLGRKLMDQIDGFRLYLSTAEQDRLEVLHPPEKTPELFEKYLPYALALDVENEWSEQFAEVLAKAEVDGRPYQPGWYSGSSWNRLDAARFSDSLGSVFASAISSAASPPGSSSGSGGGGFSGGGGGGGGGSGW